MTATIKVKVNQTQKDEVVQVLKDALDVAGYGECRRRVSSACSRRIRT